MVCLDVIASHACESTEERVLHELATKLALELLNEESYAATIAGLRYEIHTTAQGWNIQVRNGRNTPHPRVFCAARTIMPKLLYLARVNITAHNKSTPQGVHTVHLFVA